MLKRLEFGALQSDLAAVTALLRQRDEKSDPIGFRQFTRRKAEIETAIAALQGQPPTGAAVALFFGGRPVIGAKGISADFGAKALEKFQDTVSTRFAAQAGPIGTRGPVKGRDRTQMMLTDVSRGSFGFVLEEMGSADPQDERPLKESLDEVVDLIYRSADPDLEVFDEAADYLDDRVLASMSNFLKHLDDSGATLRIVEEDRDFLLTRDAVERARERIENASISDTKRDVRGRLFFMPSSRKFEVHQPSGDVLKGNISAEGWKELLQENGEPKHGVLGAIKTVTLSIREVRLRGQAPRFSYKLLAIQADDGNADDVMRSPIHSFFAILAAITTMVAVFAIKRGVEWGLQDASDTMLNVLLAVGFGLAILAIVWTYLLRPLLERRKQRQQSGLPDRAIRDRLVD